MNTKLKNTNSFNLYYINKAKLQENMQNLKTSK